MRILPTGGAGFIESNTAAALLDAGVMILRYFNPVGGHENALLGERPSGTPNNLMPYIVQVAQGRQDRLYIYGNDYPTPDGTGIRDYMGTGYGTSVLKLVREFEETNHLPVTCRITGRRPGDIAACWASADKAERRLHWRAEKSLPDICRDSWNGRKEAS